MAITTVAPCGLICDICNGFQRKKNRCTGCAGDFKPTHCAKCSILNCPEKQGCPGKPCDSCCKYPCKRLKNLEKRYSLKYGESLMENFRRIETLGLNEFLQEAEAEWTCPSCGALLCVHRADCLSCGARNARFPDKNEQANL